ncbi:uncharacterized protein OCT59_027668 [Rhizophagus irregularis]|uniref:uncharacterized protein n=1 Tax=Rhizophagus irregularis TaxID=588596 RepID=UPI000CBC67F9|nr:hypothetical protein OCT59_027668 [Rhizophagus irregularis]
MQLESILHASIVSSNTFISIAPTIASFITSATAPRKMDANNPPTTPPMTIYHGSHENGYKDRACSL